MAKKAEVRGEDVPIVKLVPLHERRLTQPGYKKIVASIASVGLIEPLCVYKEGDQYFILDGYLRYRACLDLGIHTVPCLIMKNKEAYTCNRMVNHLTPVQETRMLNKSLETLSEDTIAKALGLARIAHRVEDWILRCLHPDIVEALERKKILKVTAQDLCFVKPERQAEILNQMEKTGDFSAAYARTLILRTPPSMRNRRARAGNPWDQCAKQRKELTMKLEEAEHRYDFYSMLYRQYVTDLLKLCIYVRKIISNERLVEHLRENHPHVLERFQTIVFEAEGGARKASGE